MMSEIVVPGEYISLQPLIPLNDPIKMNEYTELVHRRYFISRVYTILWIQLLFTSIFIGLCNQSKSLQKFMISPLGINLMYLSLFMILFSSCLLFGLYNTIKKFPYNYIYLSFFTIMMTYSLGIIGVIYDTQTLLLSGLTTTGMFSGLTIYAYQTKVNYTIYGNIFVILLFGLLFSGLFIQFFQIQLMKTIYSIGGATLFSFYIIYDTQLISGGSNRKIVYSIDDYVIASVNLYLDIINLFLFMLDIIGGRN